MLLGQLLREVKHIKERARPALGAPLLSEPPNPDPAESPSNSDPPTRRPSDQTGFPARTAKNRASFLSRIIGGKKQGQHPVVERNGVEEESGDKRAEGVHAETFAHPIGYAPQGGPEPPKYIKVKARGKKERDFDRVFLAQELRGRTSLEVAQEGGRRINPQEKPQRGKSIWAMAFSLDGCFLAAGGQDHIVRVWKVLATEEDRREHEKEEEAGKHEQGTRLSAPVFRRKPVQEFQGHTESILDLSWSKNSFLLSTGMDRCVRLWHVGRSACLCAFKHGDVVSTVQFHPLDDRFFLAGSLDRKIRLWSIPDKTVAFATPAGDLITAVAFTPDGKTAVAGCLSGLCEFYSTDRLQLQTQMHVRSARGKNSKGAKITGISTMTFPPDDPSGEVKLLVTSNDSRVRMYNFRDKSLELKLKGHENLSSQIRASFSDDGRYIVSGSENSRVYIWSKTVAEKDRDKHPMEMFDAHPGAVTAALMAPVRTKELLQASADPLFTLCNPPPVQLQSLTESQRSAEGPPKDTGNGDALTASLKPKPEESPAFLARSGHKNGNIIVTADFEGHIKVFRQDCAYKPRLRFNDNWETSSSFRAIPRSPSIATRASRRSIHEPPASGPSDRILAWRQSIDRFSMSSSANASFEAFTTPASHRQGFSRSSSPPKSQSKKKSALPAAMNLPTPSGTPTALSTPAPSAIPSKPSVPNMPPEPSKLRPDRPGLLTPAARQDANPLSLPNEGVSRGSSHQNVHDAPAQRLERLHRANKDAWHGGPRGMGRDGERRPEPARSSFSESQGDRQTRQHDSGEPDSLSEASSASEEGSGEERVKCHQCGGEDFKGRKRGRRNVLICGRCGVVAE